MIRSVRLTPRHKRFIEDVRTCLYNLDIPSHRPFYEDVRFLFVSHGEHSGFFNQSHIENTGPILASQKRKSHVIVGVGFNMDAPAAPSIWSYALGSSVSFEAVYNGHEKLSQEQVRRLFDGMMFKQEEILSTLYASCWDYLRANERLAIEDAFLVGGEALVGVDTPFYRHILRYTVMGESVYLHAAFQDLMSYKTKARHVCRRRLADALLLEGINTAPQTRRASLSP